MFTEKKVFTTTIISIRYLIAYAAKHDLDIDHLKAVSAILQGDLQEEIYMIPSEFFNNTKYIIWKNLYMIEYGWKIEYFLEDFGFTSIQNRFMYLFQNKT